MKDCFKQIKFRKHEHLLLRYKTIVFEGTEQIYIKLTTNVQMTWLFYVILIKN